VQLCSSLSHHKRADNWLFVCNLVALLWQGPAAETGNWPHQQWLSLGDESNGIS